MRPSTCYAHACTIADVEVDTETGEVAVLSLKSAYEVGRVLADVMRVYPAPTRIAVIATGGLSHEPGGPRYFWVDEEFDRWFLDLLKAGDHDRLLRECTLERMEAAGSGGTAELLAWIAVLAMTRGPADVLAYMPAIAWRSGTGMVVWSEIA